MWVTNKSAITTYMTNAGYKEHKNNLEPEQITGLQNAVYVLKPEGISITDITSNNIRETDIIELSVIYFNADTTKRDGNFDSFRQVLEGIKNLGQFAGFEGDATFGQLEGDANKSIGRVKFYFGYKDC